EREVIGERTRDKIAAARRKGKWAGGRPILGYDVASTAAGGKLAVNEGEADRVRRIFDLYLEHEALIPTVQELAKRGWHNKGWTTRKGRAAGGRPFDKAGLYKLLTNRTYTGVVVHKGQAYPGEHPALVDQPTFDKLQAVLARNGRGNGSKARNKHGALLGGLLACGSCGCGMAHTYTVKGSRRYRYYVCLRAQKHGWAACPTKSVPAGPVEQHVVEQVRRAARDPAVLDATLKQVEQQQARAVAEAEADRRAAERLIGRKRAAVTAAVAAGDAAAVAKAEQAVADAQRKAEAAKQRHAEAKAAAVGRAEVEQALAAFDPAWDQLSPKDRARAVRLLVERVAYDGAAGTVAVTFRPRGIRSLAAEQEQRTTEAA
ncbi:MAG TPA: recombinase family protein, partial [Humisphaera sp.]